LLECYQALQSSKSLPPRGLCDPCCTISLIGLNHDLQDYRIFRIQNPLFDMFASAACRTKDKKSYLNLGDCLNAIRRFHHSKILLHHHLPLFDMFASAACGTKDKKSSLNFGYCLNAIRRFHHSKILLHHHLHCSRFAISNRYRRICNPNARIPASPSLPLFEICNLEPLSKDL
jgi:hypothetical protein